MTHRETWSDDVETGTRSLLAAGLACVAVFLVAFVGWAVYAPLAGAAVAPGIVAAAGQNQRVQHFEGGIVRRILVREGEAVTAGQVVVALDATSATAQRNALRNEALALAARAERLVAERDGMQALVFSQNFSAAAASADVAGILSEQDKEFRIRLERYRQEGVILRQRVNALNDQIEGLSAQELAVERQLDVVKEETERKRQLLAKGLTDRSEYTALLRSEAELVGQQGQAKSSILASKTQIVEAEEQFARLATQRIETAATSLNDVRTQISSAEERLRTAEAVLERTAIRSPSDGLVVKLFFNSVGSIIRPGDPILELLPTTDDLVIEARLSPRDIDVVSVGQAATLRFSALNSRTTPVAPASVTYVSADRLIDPGTSQPYYVARLKMTAGLPNSIDAKRIYPGMRSRPTLQLERGASSNIWPSRSRTVSVAPSGRTDAPTAIDAKTCFRSGRGVYPALTLSAAYD